MTVAVASAEPRAFVISFSDLDRWSVDNYRRVEWRWPAGVMRLIGEVLRCKHEPVPPGTETADLPIIGKIAFGGDVALAAKERRNGYKGRLFWAEAGDLIYSKIRVKQGSVAVVPEQFARLAVSAEYPVYEIDHGRADGRYLELVLRSSAFLRMLDGIAHGGSTKTRVPPREFERQTIPLLPLVEQEAVVSEWTRAQSELAKIRLSVAEVRATAESEFLAALGLTVPLRIRPPKVFAVEWKALERWSVRFNQMAHTSLDLGVGTYPVQELGDLAAVSYGVQKSPANRPGQKARPYLSVANVQRGRLDLSKVKTIDVSGAELSNLRLEPGDLLFVEGNGSREELGRCAIWSGEIEDCVHQNHILKVRPDKTRLLTDFALTWFNTAAGKDHFFRSAKTSSGLGTINSSELRAAPIPLPPIPVQRDLVARVAELRKRASKLEATAETREREAKIDVEARVLGEGTASAR